MRGTIVKRLRRTICFLPINEQPKTWRRLKRQYKRYPTPYYQSWELMRRKDIPL